MASSSYEATNVVLSKIKSIEPENASKIMGYLLMNLEDSELVRLACSPDPVLHNIVIRVKTHLGLTLSSPSSSPSPLNPITRPSTNPFSKSSPRLVASNGFDFARNPSSPSSSAWPLSGIPNNPISPKSSPLLSYENIRSVAVHSPSFSPRVNGDCNPVGGDFVDEQQVDEYFPFLGDSSKNEELLDLGGQNLQSLNNGDAPFHRRSYSASDACFGFEEGGPGIGYKPCLYFARGFCKNGSNCKFVHGALNDSFGAIVGSPSRFEGLEQHEEFLRLKTEHHRRLMASQLVAGTSPSSYDKYIDFLIMQQNDPQRAAATTAYMMGEEFHNFGRGRPERNEFLAMISAEKPNSASRQIYLTFPAESSFKDEDVSEYFSKFGPVQDVRIPYQQKRMFGFVTFVYPETVRLILSKGNPHFICDSRVLVKPYKEKGKIPDKRQQQQQSERGDFSPCLSPRFDSKEPYDFHLGARMLYNPHDILLRRKLEEQAELQQVIDLQERRLKNLQLPDFKNIPIHHHHHQRSHSVGAPSPLSHQLHGQVSTADLSSQNNIKGDLTGYQGGLSYTLSLGTAEGEEEQPQPQKEVGPAFIGGFECSSENNNANANVEVKNLDNRNVEQALPDSFFASPTKAAGDNVSDFSSLAGINESAALSASTYSHNELEQETTSGEMATSH
ncbi:zinc finger CCCH domain-containing protein 55-like [Arachis stenosperma]|uniref:zinc finger CCCH domain-containing protein 55-like n=1 Tax=Arachis stenosperma TaxID=217475 RepID=UPI0025AB8B05|nr:zinc finger CCCH domain-containing protein 55-like [Arachis stenosperma]XP_057758671.1 zinc finger CCCH domain-containing protein 55-like [Arachis stenosperma]XP_057758672.1 zinc finger CCCH domain-containing protein 55-like [Arachis stenosperma]